MSFLNFNLLVASILMISNLSLAGLNPICLKVMGIEINEKTSMYLAPLATMIPASRAIAEEYYYKLASENWSHPTAENTAALLRANYTPYRKQAAINISALKDSDPLTMFQLIEQTLKDPNVEVRFFAASHLSGSVPSPEYARVLGSALRSSDPEVENFAIKEFQSTSDPYSLNEIKKELSMELYEDPSETLTAYKLRLIKSLRYRTDDGALALTVHAVSHYWLTTDDEIDPDFYNELAENLVESPNPKAKDEIIKFLNYRDGGANIHYLRLKLGALYFAKNNGDPTDIPWMKKLLLGKSWYSSDFNDNSLMIDSLTKIGNTEAKKVLADVLVHSTKRIAVLMRAKRPDLADNWKKQIKHINFALSSH